MRNSRICRVSAIESTTADGRLVPEPPSSAETWAADYLARVARHREEIRAETRRLDWLFSVHNTDRSAAELLLFLHGGMTVNKAGQIGRRA